MAESLWRYCSVCRRNHDEGMKHRYSKQHKNRLAVILAKFSKKVHSARRCLQRPVVVDGELEPGARLWCYCCELEIDKHTTDGDVSIEWGGLLQHMTCSDHHKKVRHFWWVQGADKALLQNYILFKAEYARYKSLVSEELRKLLDKQDKKMEQLSVEQTSLQQTLEPPLPITHEPTAKDTKPASSTSSVCGGNVHTGATPPWLQGDGDSGNEVGSKVNSIGPSVEEFIKHREREARKLKNPRRVGADFHLQVASQKDDDSWLPSFGRVWNHGPRSHSMVEFRQELELKSSGKPATVSDTPASSTRRTTASVVVASPSSEQSGVKPYVRKRIIKRDHSSPSASIDSAAD